MSDPLDLDSFIEVAIRDLNIAGVLYTELSKKTKETVTKLEHNITLYARHDDLAKFITNVRKWRVVMLNNWKVKEQMK